MSMRPVRPCVQSERATDLSCAWCHRSFDGSDRHEVSWVVCSSCGVATTSPWPTPEELAAAYAGWYRPDAGRFAGPGDRLFDRLRGQLARRVTRIAPSGPVLDVGAGTGSLVKALRRRGRCAIGIERPIDGGDEPRLPIVGRRDGPAVVPGEIGSVDGSWAGILFWHSLEHLQAPGSAVDHAARLLAPGGVLVVALPNPTSYQARLFGPRWFGRDIPRHLVHVPPASLVARLEQNGLRVRRLSYWRGGQIVFGWLDGLVGTIPRLALYDAIRRPEARASSQSGARTLAALAAGVALMPVAVAAAVIEVAARAGGTVYVEAIR